MHPCHPAVLLYLCGRMIDFASLFLEPCFPVECGGNLGRLWMNTVRSMHQQWQDSLEHCAITFMIRGMQQEACQHVPEQKQQR